MTFQILDESEIEAVSGGVVTGRNIVDSVDTTLSRDSATGVELHRVRTLYDDGSVTESYYYTRRLFADAAASAFA